jgi:HSF-type DNA-binding
MLEIDCEDDDNEAEETQEDEEQKEKDTTNVRADIIANVGARAVASGPQVVVSSPNKPSSSSQDGEEMYDGVAGGDSDDGDDLVAYSETFPEKLTRLIRECKEGGLESIVSYNNAGNVFFIHNRKRFLSEVAPKYFRVVKYSSFKRQLYMYGFQYIADGPEKGGYHHKFFHRDDTGNLHRIRRSNRKVHKKST